MVQFFRCHTCLPAITEASIAAALVSFGNCRWLSIVRATKSAAAASVPMRKKSRAPRLVMTGAAPGATAWPGGRSRRR